MSVSFGVKYAEAFQQKKHMQIAPKILFLINPAYKVVTERLASYYVRLESTFAAQD